MLNVIKTKKEYEDALARVYNLMQKDIKKGSDDEIALEFLVPLIQKYESEKCIIPSLNPIETLQQKY